MKWFSRFVFAVSTLGLSFVSLAWADSSKPNVLFVVSDDLNYMLGGLGHPECKTPNLDEFAMTATSFTRAYCQFPLCGPSRASIMTGQYPGVNGVAGNGGDVSKDRITLPKHFMNHGYWTGRVSKIYHMGIPVDIVQGTPGGDHPRSWNEAHNLRALETMTPGKIANYTEPEAHLSYPGERKRWKAAAKSGTAYEMPHSVRGQYAVVEVADEDVALLPDTMAADQAIEILGRRTKEEKPFFLAVGFVRPHFPFVATEKSLSPYDAEEVAYPASPDDDYDDIPQQAINGRIDFPEEPVRELRRGYYGAVSFMDQQFGRLIGELDRLDLRKNTIVVFVSDHGYMLGEHHMWKKTKLWEEAIHVPLLISVPGQKQGQICNEFVELIDLYPTLSDLAGLPADEGAQGLSLLSLLEDPSGKRPEKPDALIQIGAGHCLRAGKWAYMWYPRKKKNRAAAMLFDMEKDPEQFANLAGLPEYAETVKELHERLMVRVAKAENR